MLISVLVVIMSHDIKIEDMVGSTVMYTKVVASNTRYVASTQPSEYYVEEHLSSVGSWEDDPLSNTFNKVP